MAAECPSCDYKMTLGGRLRIGQRVTCPACRAELQVIWLDPVELDFPYDDDEEEFDDDEDD